MNFTCMYMQLNKNVHTYVFKKAILADILSVQGRKELTRWLGIMAAFEMSITTAVL